MYFNLNSEESFKFEKETSLAQSLFNMASRSRIIIKNFVSKTYKLIKKNNNKSNHKEFDI